MKGQYTVIYLYDRLIQAIEKLRGRQDLESRLLLRVLTEPGTDSGSLLSAVEEAEKL